MANEVGLDARTSEALLRRFEPVIRFTKGEWFYPMDVEPYVRACGLWVGQLVEEAVCVVPVGDLDLEKLAQQPEDSADAVHYLKIPPPEEEKWGFWTRLHRRRARDGTVWPPETFRAGRGRLARVGYVSRLADALFSLVLLVRGRVAGGDVEGARVFYGRLMQREEHFRYHGRVVRQEGWIVLQYWLFYAFNDWRSNFFGANDHEADWEKIFVYLSESDEGEICPEWVAYAAHEEAGDDLRRRWDDPELEKSGEHPMVYVCAGSHASRYFPGEYLTELAFPLPRAFATIRRVARWFWYKTLRQYSDEYSADRAYELFTIPFVDYGRGDGLSVGPGQDKEWDPPRLMMNPLPTWVSGYRGLWGLYTRDPFEGEDAPAGPMYDRDKTISREWYDPVGWAGLDKVPTRAEELNVILKRQANIEAHCVRVRSEILEKSSQLKALGIEAEATRDRSHLRKLHETQMRHIEGLSKEVEAMRAELSNDEVLHESLKDHAERMRSGERPPAHAHIARAALPVSEAETHAGRVAQLWASISVAVVLVTLVGIFAFQRQHLLSALVFAIAVFAFVEASFRRRLTRFIGSANVGLALVGALVLLQHFFWQAIVFAVLAVGLYILWDNLRELGR